MTRTTNPSHQPNPRRGLVSVAMLIALIILGLVAGGLLKVAFARRTLLKVEEHKLQAEVLADSGVSRALARIDGHPEYEGEVWEVSAQELGDRGGAKVTITVKPDSDRLNTRWLVVVADYASASPGPVRQTRTLRLPFPHPVLR